LPAATLEQTGVGGAHFLPTHWSVVLAAGWRDSPQATEALERLCQAYWYPLYAYIRRKGYPLEEAQDLTQEFFLHVLRGEFLSRADRAKGKFRSYLLGALEHFLAKQWRRSHRLKRGGGCQILSLKAEPGESRYRLEPFHELTAEKLYNQSWAMMLLEQAMNALKEECESTGKSQLFEELKTRLDGDDNQASYEEVALRLKMREGAVRMATVRLRRRFGELLRAEIAHTVADPSEVDGEVRFLLAALRR